MKRVLTLKRIYNLFKLIAEQHPMINGFFIGDEFQASSYVDSAFPLLILSVEMGVSQSSEHTDCAEWDITFKVLDNITTPISDLNYQEILSDSLSKTQQISISIIKLISTLQSKINIYIRDNSFHQMLLYKVNNDMEYGFNNSFILTGVQGFQVCNNFDFDITTPFYEC